MRTSIEARRRDYKEGRPHRALEGLSPVILENMGLGVAIIASDIAENEFVVGDTAITFRRGDVDDLHAKLAWALEHPAEMQATGLRGRERARREFSWDRCAETYERLFQALLAGR